MSRNRQAHPGLLMARRSPANLGDSSSALAPAASRGRSLVSPTAPAGAPAFAQTPASPTRARTSRRTPPMPRRKTRSSRQTRLPTSKSRPARTLLTLQSACSRAKARWPNAVTFGTTAVSRCSIAAHVMASSTARLTTSASHSPSLAAAKRRRIVGPHARSIAGSSTPAQIATSLTASDANGCHQPNVTGATGSTTNRTANPVGRTGSG